MTNVPPLPEEFDGRPRGPSALTRMSAATLAVALAGACGSAGDASDRVVRRDSAGVEIVETSAPVWSQTVAWRVESDPLLTIGRVEGDEDYLFGQIEGVVRLPDGTVAVADGQSRLISYYDPEGRFLNHVGGPGGGPTEFGSLHGLWQCGPDLVYGHDLYGQRVKVWNGAGEFVRDFPLLEPGEDARGPYHEACSRTGEFLVAGWGDRSGVPRDRTLLYSQPAPIWLLDRDGRMVRELGDFIVSERIAYVTSNGGGGSGPHPFGRSVRFALSDSLIYIGTAERLDIDVYDRTGARVRSMRGPAVDLSIDETLLDRYADAGIGGGTAMLIDLIREEGIEMPDGYAAYSELIIDAEQNVWAKRFQFPWEPASRWAVFASDGSFLGHVDMPAGLTVHQIGRDWVLGVTRDELDVQRVALHRLDRAASVAPDGSTP